MAHSHTCSVPGQNDRPIQNTVAYKSLIIPYFHQILDSIFLSTCSLSIRTGCFYMHLINRGPYLSESRHGQKWSQ